MFTDPTSADRHGETPRREPGSYPTTPLLSLRNPRLGSTIRYTLRPPTRRTSFLLGPGTHGYNLFPFTSGSVPSLHGTSLSHGSTTVFGPERERPGVRGGTPYPHIKKDLVRVSSLNSPSLRQSLLTWTLLFHKEFDSTRDT